MKLIASPARAAPCLRYYKAKPPVYPHHPTIQSAHSQNPDFRIRHMRCFSSASGGLQAAESEGAGIAVNSSGIPNPMVEVTRTTPSSLVADARAQYNLVSGRAMFLDQFASTPEAQAYFTDEELSLMHEGTAPPDWVVHHEQPLFRGGDNSYDNLILVPKQWHTDNFFDLHFYPEGQNPFGRN